MARDSALRGGIEPEEEPGDIVGIRPFQPELEPIGSAYRRAGIINRCDASGGKLPKPPQVLRTSDAEVRWGVDDEGFRDPRRRPHGGCGQAEDGDEKKGVFESEQWGRG